jgi:hypothetical protein
VSDSSVGRKFQVEDATIRLATAVVCVVALLGAAVTISVSWANFNNRILAGENRFIQTDTKLSQILTKLDGVVSAEEYKKDKLLLRVNLDRLRDNLDLMQSQSGENQPDRWRCSHTLRLCREAELLNEGFTCGKIDYCTTPDDPA